MRIAAPVVPLVVVEDDRRRVAQGPGLLEHDLADLRMLRHDPPFRIAELARVGQDLVRDRELAEVVEEARGPDPLDLAAGQVERPGQADRHLRDHRRRPARPRRPGEQGVLEGGGGGAHRRPPDLHGPGARLRPDRGAPDDAALLESRGTRRPDRARAPSPSRAPHRRRGRGRRAGGSGRGPPATPALSVTSSTWPSSSRDLAPADETAQLLGAGRGRIGVRLGHDDHEFLAAVATHEVDRPDVRAQDVGDFAQDGVAGHVAVGVVDPLEVVEVDQDDRARPLVAGRALELVLEPGEQRLAVERRRSAGRPWRGSRPGPSARRGDRTRRAGARRRPWPVSTVPLRSDDGGEPLGQLRDPAHLAAPDGGGIAGRSDERPHEGDREHPQGETGLLRDGHLVPTLPQGARGWTRPVQTGADQSRTRANRHGALVPEP